MDEDLLAEIIAGATPEENPADPLHMCLSVVTVEFSLSSERYEFPWSHGVRFMPAARWMAESFTHRLRVVGKILCPIFTVVKPKEYVNEMRGVRLQYQGIASDPAIQVEYAEKVKTLLEDGYFRSVEQAIESDMPARLARDIDRPKGGRETIY